MSYPQKRPLQRQRRSQENDAKDVSFSDLAKNGAIGAGFALLSAALLSVISAALCMLYPDPNALTLYIGLAILYISSIIGGVVSSIKLRKNRGIALLAGGICGFVFAILLGIISVAVSFIPYDLSHGIKLLPSLLLRFASIPLSVLGAYMGSRKRFPSKRRKKR